MALDSRKLHDFVEESWRFSDHEAPQAGHAGTIVTALEAYIAIPNDSPGFDPEWDAHGHMDDALRLFEEAVETLKSQWAQQGCKTDDIVSRVVGSKDAPQKTPDGKRRTPLLLIEVPAFRTDRGDSVLLYGHLDKQPGLAASWSEGLGPRDAVIRDGKLYGRGGADDGYAAFCALSAIMAVRAQNRPHARAVILVEACEESGSSDLDHYIELLAPTLGDVSLIACLDSGCLSYDRMWTTNSLRGIVNGTLRVRVTKAGIHSGDASGAVPSSFRIARALLSRLEDERTGEIMPRELRVDIPADIATSAAQTAAILGDTIYRKYAFVNDGVRPTTDDAAELLLNRTWRTQLAVIGADGVPPIQGAGNVMLPQVALGLSFRLPPTLNCRNAADFIKKTLEAAPPYNAEVSFDIAETGNGWAAPTAAPWLAAAVSDASKTFFGDTPVAMGEGGSIPFMNMLRETFPRAQFLVTGILGPGSGAHGPDEFLHLPATQKLTMCVAAILEAHAV